MPTDLMSFLFLQLSRIMTASAFFSQLIDALIGSNAPGPVQKIEHASGRRFEHKMNFPFIT